ncbi:unnamed protein product [Phytophthora fragariaefolia]|uniref:Unnamed protein product n=1 Tax=Phytophthora fragariaefolia TaxID=1490495 RepID=A0A9W7D2N3_9STRA|nr:unnamed protein product [Phytophthora fragariaefolia]
MVFISYVSNSKNQRLIVRQYGNKMERLLKYLSPEYHNNPKYQFGEGTYGETHLYENISADQFYDKLENALSPQKNAYKVNLALGYQLYDPVNNESIYFYPNIANTYVYDKPFVNNSRADLRKVITDIRTKDLSDTLNYPKSGIKTQGYYSFQDIL